MANRSDNFNRTASSLGTPSDAGANWIEGAGSYATGTDGGSGQMVAYCDGSGGPSAWLECSVTDHEATGEIINVGSSSQSGVHARLVDDNNYYYWFVNSSGAASLYKKVAGSFTLLASGSGTFTPGVGNTITLRCQGTTITGLLGVTSSASASDSSLTTGTKAGIRCNENGFFPYYNSFSITDLAAAGTFTASSAVTVGAATCSASATRGASVATSAVNVGAATCSASATFTDPVYSATAAVNVGAATCAASATRGAFVATSAVACGPVTCAISATFTKPTYTATSAVTVGAATCSAAALRGAFVATSAVNVGPATCAIAATFTGTGVPGVYYTVLQQCLGV